MRKSKRAVLVLVLLGVITYLASTWMLGSKIETLLADNDPKIESQLPFVKFSERKFERGFFQSSESIKATLNLPGAENIQFTLKSTVKNGPIPNMSGFAAAVVDSELRVNEGYQQEVKNWLGTGVLLTSHATYPLIGQEGEAHLTVPGFITPRLSWNGMTLTVNFSKDLTRIKLQGGVPKVEFHWDAGTGLRIAGFHYDSDQKQVFSDDPTLYSGSHQITVEQLIITPGAQASGTTFPPLITVKQMSTSDTSTLIGNEFIDYVEKGNANSLQVNKQEYGPAHLDVSLNHVHARTLSDLIRNSYEADNQSPAPLKLPQIAALRQELIKQGMEISIDRLSLTTPQGEASLSSSIKLNDASQSNFTDRNKFIGNLAIKIDVSFPEEFVRNLQKKFGGPDQTEDQINTKIQDAIGHGYVIHDGGMLRSNIEFKNGQVRFNGIPYVPPVPPPYIAGQSGTFPGNVPTPLAIKLNCVACHALDHRVVGPSWVEIATRYHSVNQFEYNGRNFPLAEGLVMKVSRGGSGNWGFMPMPAMDPYGHSQAEISTQVNFILSLSKSDVPKPGIGIAPPRHADAIPPVTLGESFETFLADMKRYGTTGAVIDPHSASYKGDVTYVLFSASGVRLYFMNSGQHNLYTIRYEPPYAGKIRGIGIGDSLFKLQDALGTPDRSPWQFGIYMAYLYSGENGQMYRFDVGDGMVKTMFLLDK